MFKPNLDIPPIRQRIFIQGALVGEVVRPWSWQSESGGWQVARPYALVCSACLEVWAMLPFVERQEPFVIHSVACPAHADPYGNVPGSLFPRWGWLETVHDPFLFAALPRELLQREFNLHINHLLRS